MSQIYSTLAYYWDNKEELDADMQRRFEKVEALRQQVGESAAGERFWVNPTVRQELKTLSHIDIDVSINSTSKEA